MEDWFEINRRNWDERVPIHRRNATGSYAIEALRNGGEVLHGIEAAELGSVNGLDVVHLQCHFGVDSLALERLGARVTGLDFSPVAIATARELSREIGLPARFVEGNIYDAPRLIAERFDLAFVSWGALNWLPDVAGWAKVVSTLLKPGGRLYLVEGHPGIMPLEQENGQLVFRYAWRQAPDRPLRFDTPITYTGDPDVLANSQTREWIHPLSEVVGGLIAAGLRLDFLHEHEMLAWPAFPMMVEAPGRLYRLPPEHPPLPLSYSLQATKL